MQPPTQHPTHPSSTIPPGQFPPIGISLDPFQPRIIAPGLSHLGVVPLGHYPFDQIPFLFLPPRILSTHVMDTLSLPNITLEITI